MFICPVVKKLEETVDQRHPGACIGSEWFTYMDYADDLEVGQWMKIHMSHSWETNWTKARIQTTINLCPTLDHKQVAGHQVELVHDNSSEPEPTEPC